MADDPFDRTPDTRHGVAEAVAPGVRRVVAPNPSPMTFTGTASYLVGESALAVIDPGPDDPRHLDALRAAIGDARVAAILVTHSHRDHSALARPLADETGAPVLAYGPHGAGMSARMRARAEAGAALGGGEGADAAFAPDRALADGETVEGEGWRLTALHTPGHISNHLAFALDGAGALFTGDCVMGWATTLVSPPDGDMRAFMASLARLRARDDALYLPGHGRPVADPRAMLDWQIAHRRAREAQIREALAEGPADAASLAARIYSDLDPALLPAAARNVFAHLLAMEEEHEAAADGAPGAATRFRLS